MKEKVKHTPGPLAVVCNPKPYHYDVVDSVGVPLAEVFGRANAYLYAAAPDLLEALKNLCNRHTGLIESAFGRLPNDEQDHELADAQAAIEKAEGRK